MQQHFAVGRFLFFIYLLLCLFTSGFSLYAQNPNPFDGNAIFELIGQNINSSQMQKFKQFLKEDPDTQFSESLWFSRVKGVEVGITDDAVVRVFVHGKSPYNYGTQPFKGTYPLGIEYTDSKTQIISQLGPPFEEGAMSLVYFVKHKELLYATTIEINDDGQSIKHTFIKLGDKNQKPSINSQYHGASPTAIANKGATIGQTAAPAQAPTKGCVEGNCYDGLSTYIWDSGSKYIGEYSKGKREGFGLYLFSNGDQYIGEWTDNQRHGTGTYIYSTTGQYKKYLGEWHEGKRSGIGLMEYQNGDKKLGEWEENEPIEFDGNKGCLAGDCKNTYSDYIWQDMGRYIGNFRAEKPHGKGTMYFADGSKYAGFFKDGLAHGQGTFYGTDGGRYEGEWVEGIKQGFGTMFYPDGTVDRGEWKNGVFVP